LAPESVRSLTLPDPPEAGVRSPTARASGPAARRSAALALALALLAGGVLRGGARADDEGAPADARQGARPTEPVAKDELDAADGGVPRAAVRAAVERGLAWLAATHETQPGGGFPPAGAKQYAPLATTALGALAYMAAGNTPGRGPYSARLEAAVDYLLARVDRAPDSPLQGFISDAGRDPLSRTHGHGYATLALSQAFTLSPRTPRGASLREALELAVFRTERSQGLEGGWGYEPVRGLDHEGSVTITLVQGLRAAKDAGIHVEPAVIHKAEEYVQKSQKEDGSFRYRLGDDRSSVALTAAALATLQATGKYTGKLVSSGFDYLERELAAREADVGTDQGEMYRPHYERLYLALSLWQHPDPRVFERWYQRTARELIATQGQDGAWSSDYYGQCYATAINLLVLTLPDELLPAFQR
jgi:hypothetical protein